MQTQMNANGSDLLAQSASVSLMPNRIVPSPRDLQETGLPRSFILDLLLKHLYKSGDLDLRQLVVQLALTGAIVENVIASLREQSAIESKRGLNGELRYGLTEKGRSLAVEAITKNAYAGAAPVTLEQYRAVVAAQSIRNATFNRAQLVNAFSDAIVSSA
jgi:DNA-binding MarR family transcriptional regulator